MLVVVPQKFPLGTEVTFIESWRRGPFDPWYHVGVVYDTYVQGGERWYSFCLLNNCRVSSIGKYLEVAPMRFTPNGVVTCVFKGSPARTLDAMIYGDFAVHRDALGSSVTFTVSHRHSGMALLMGMTLGDATRLAQEVEPIGLAATTIKEAAKLPETKKIYKICQRYIYDNMGTTR